MYVFIDDSGDPGFKFDKGSSRFFVIACCVFETQSHAEEVTFAIREIRRSLGFSLDGEFKFSHSQEQVHRRFFLQINPAQFFVRVVVIDKHHVDRQELLLGQRSLEQWAIARALSHPSIRLNDARVFIDGKQGAKYRNMSQNLVRRSPQAGSAKPIRRVRFVDSRENPLIQLADMVAGCARRSMEVERKNHEIYRWMLGPLLRQPRASLEQL